MTNGPRPLVDPEGDLSRTSDPAVLAVAEYWAERSRRASHEAERRVAVRASERAFLEAERRGVPDAAEGRAALLASVGRITEAEQLADAIVERGGAPVHHVLARSVTDPVAWERLKDRAAQLGVLEVLAERADALLDRVEGGDHDPQLLVALDENLRRQNEAMRADRSRTTSTEVATRVAAAAELIDRSLRASSAVAAAGDPSRAAAYAGDAVQTVTSDVALAPRLHRVCRDEIDGAYMEWVDRLDEVVGEPARRDVVEDAVAAGNAQLGLLSLRFRANPAATFAMTKAAFEQAIADGVPTAAAQWVKMLSWMVIEEASDAVWSLDEDDNPVGEELSMDDLVERMAATTNGPGPVDPAAADHEFRRSARDELVRVATEQADQEPQLLMDAAEAFRTDPVVREMLLKEAAQRGAPGSGDALYSARQWRVGSMVSDMDAEQVGALADRMATGAGGDLGGAAEVLRIAGERFVDAGDADRGREYLSRAADHYVEAARSGDAAALRGLASHVMNAWNSTYPAGALAGGKVPELLEDAEEIARSVPGSAGMVATLANQVAFVAEARPDAFGREGLSREEARGLAATCERAEGSVFAAAFEASPDARTAVDYVRTAAREGTPGPVLADAMRRVEGWVVGNDGVLDPEDRTDLAEALCDLRPDLAERVLVGGDEEHRQAVVTDWLYGGTSVPLPLPPERWERPGEPDGLGDDGLGGTFAEPVGPGPFGGSGGALPEPPRVTIADLGLDDDFDLGPDGDGIDGPEVSGHRSAAPALPPEPEADPDVDLLDPAVVERLDEEWRRALDDSVGGSDDGLDVTGF